MGNINEKSLSYELNIYTDGMVDPHETCVEKDFKNLDHPEYSSQSDKFIHLASTYYLGKNGKKCFKKAAEFYQKAVELNSSHAMYHLGYMYYHGIGVNRDVDKTFLLCENANNLGNSCAMYQLGVIYNERLGTEKAMPYFEKSAICGNSDAMFELGKIYQQYGFYKNTPKALSLFN